MYMCAGQVLYVFLMNSLVLLIDDCAPINVTFAEKGQERQLVGVVCRPLNAVWYVSKGSEAKNIDILRTKVTILILWL